MAEEWTSPVDVAQAMLLMKQRLNRMTGISAADEYFEHRIKAAIERLNRKGITLTDSVDDLMLVVDYAVWQYGNRDKPGADPDWLKDEIRNRWLSERQVGADDP